MKDYSSFVEHPRFGRKPRLTGLHPLETPDGSVVFHWHSGPKVRVMNTAVAADLTKQRPATIPVTHYFDAKRICRRCERPFLFFAEEQKYWYEELRFPLEADCLECVLCRKSEQQLDTARRKYERLLARSDRAEDDTLSMVECAVLLIESSVFSKKLIPKLRGFLKPALSAPDAPGSTRAKALLSRINNVERREGSP